MALRRLDIRNRLIEQHLAIVPPIARAVAKSLPPSFDIDDLLSVGNLALVKAADRYRPKEHGGAPFSAYARMVIRGAMIDSVRGRNYIAATHAPIDAAPEAAYTPAAEEAVDQARQVERVRNVVTLMTASQRAVMELYYSPDEPTVESVAKVVSISRRKATQLHVDGVRQVRAALKPVA